jgi:hypothetical protein
VDYTGAGQPLFDTSASFGSSGRLLGVNVLDAYDRGIVSNNATHEIVHQWGAFLDFALGLNSDFAHYNARSSVGSLVGGFLWTDNQDGTFTVQCNEGRNGATHAPPLDQYLMGLIDGSAVPTQRVYSDAIVHKCITGEPVTAGEIVATVTIPDIQNVEGVRIPGPASARRRFAIAFVAETHGRLFNPTELTYYEILARHYTTSVAPLDPDPHLGFNWAPVTRFFGEGTTWQSEVLPAPEIPALSLAPRRFLAALLLTAGVWRLRIRVRPRAQS